MFYADFVLSKKGPLARIWLAAHWDKKLTKAQIFETNIESSIERILRPKVKLALRTSGHLMLGVVRIYSRKTKYLLADCNEAFVKIKMAFRPGMVDLPEDHREAAVNAVTLPEVFHNFDSAIPDLNDADIEAQFTLNQSRADEITIREDYGNVPALHTDDGFGINFDASSEVIIGHSFEGNAFGESHPFGDTSRGGLFEAGLFKDAMMPDEHPVTDPTEVEHAIASTSKSPRIPRPDSVQPHLNDDDDFDDDHFIPPSPGGGSSDGSRPPSPLHGTGTDDIVSVPTVASNQELFPMSNDIPEQPMEIDLQHTVDGDWNQGAEGIEQNEMNQNAEQTTLLQNEEESFALAPVDASALRGLPKTKRKRKLIVDEVKNISGEEMKAQLSDTSDIVITLDLAPPTKRLMHWKETGGVEKLFALPGKNIPSTALFKNYQRHLTSKATPNDEVADERDHLDGVRDNQDMLDVNTQQVAPVPSRRGRKRKQPIDEEEQQPPVDTIPPQVIHDELSSRFSEAADQSRAEVTAEHVRSSTQSYPPLTENNVDQSILDVSQQILAPITDKDMSHMFTNVGYDENDAEVLNQDPDAIQNPFNMDDHEINPITPGVNAGGGVTPWHDADYDNPVSVGPMIEERGVDETVEQFEERLLNKRAGHLYSTIRMRISTEVGTIFSDLIYGNSKKQVAQKFYSLLVLKKHRILELTQNEPYGIILLTKGSNFDDPKL